MQLPHILVSWPCDSSVPASHHSRCLSRVGRIARMKERAYKSEQKTWFDPMNRLKLHQFSSNFQRSSLFPRPSHSAPHFLVRSENAMHDFNLQNQWWILIFIASNQTSFWRAALHRFHSSACNTTEPTIKIDDSTQKSPHRRPIRIRNVCRQAGSILSRRVWLLLIFASLSKDEMYLGSPSTTHIGYRRM